MANVPTDIHPHLRALAEAAAGKPGLADTAPEQARAGMAARTASRPRGPEIERVFDLRISHPDGELPVRVYRPANPLGVALAFHGGGWLMGNLDSFDATCRHLAAESGLAIVNVDYRLAPEHLFPAAAEDAWIAATWVAAHGHEHDLPVERLAVLGESAGGNLAAGLCLRARDEGGPRILAQVLIYPATDARQESASMKQYANGYGQRSADVTHAFKNYGLGRTAKVDDWRLSPLLAASHADLPPALVITAECDVVRDDGEAYAARLAEAGVSATCVRYVGMLHTFFGMRGQLDAAGTAQRQAADALRAAAQNATG
ncbi:MAG: alpha/beta hydrolase [Comamonadaceae bacterium]|nr:MAG: alpha/beta hydrolase [Comamonadaceae bacterium]